MTKVFIGGSRAISRLSEDVRGRLDNIVRQDFPVLVGDANGADKAIQRHFLTRGYDNLEIFCSGQTCRNNVGGWKMRHVTARAGARGVEFYSAKDRTMAEEATVGLMIWDGESAGTLLNVLRLVSDGKIAVMHNVPGNAFVEFRGPADWDGFIAGRGALLRRKIAERAAFEPAIIRDLALSALHSHVAAE